jgi:2-polyprenyl-3-methyl-5-hydroxy-6-metoxy-1,4-benzoquinol methylase
LLSGYGFDDPNESFTLARCDGCGVVSLDPLLPPEELTRYYAMSYYGGNNEEKLKPLAELLVRGANRLRARALLAKLGPHQPSATRIVDVGCGRGGFLKYLHGRGYDCVGLEIPSFPLPPSSPGLTFLHASLEEAPIAPASVDAISIWHVLEHIPLPGQVVRRAAELLRPGGVLAVAVPNFGSAQRALFGRHWFHLDLPRHLHHFDREALGRVLGDAGLEVVSTSTASIDQNYFGFMQSALNALFPSRPNRLYSLLKKQTTGPRTPAFDLMQLALGAALFPASLLENALALPFGRGATLVTYARKV